MRHSLSTPLASLGLSLGLFALLGVSGCSKGTQPPEAEAEAAPAATAAPASADSEVAGGGQAPPAPGSVEDADAAAVEEEAVEAKGDANLGPRAESGPAASPVGEFAVGGALDRDIIRRVALDHSSEIRACYEKGLRRDPELSGRFDVVMVIGPDGGMDSAKARDAQDYGDPEVVECIVEAVEGWTFPPPGEGEVQVIYPFITEPTERRP